MDVNQSSHDVWPSPMLVHYIHFRALLPPKGILPGAKCTLLPSLGCLTVQDLTRQLHAACRQLESHRRVRDVKTESLLDRGHAATCHNLTAASDAVMQVALSSVAWLA